MRPHGRTAYLYGCRCEVCRDACSRYERGRQLDILSGRPRMVDSTGARRRIQGLQRLGWSAEYLSIELGHSRAWLTVTLSNERIYRRNHEKIAALYARLRDTPGSSVITAMRAEKAGYSEPDAWWDIDDPDEQPDPGYDEYRSARDSIVDEVLVDRILSGDMTLARSATKAERVEVVARWRADGRALNELERLTSWEPRRYVRKAS